MLHGLFGEGENLRGIARGLEPHFRCVLVDLPNHGDSPHIDSIDYPDMADAVARSMRDVESANGRSFVLGHSMGGKVAMHLALRHPDMVRALVVLDIAPRRYDPSHTGLIDALDSLPLETISNRTDADRALADAIPAAAVRSFLLKNLVRGESGLRWKLNVRGVKESYAAILSWEAEGTYTGPALFIGGTESDYLRPERDRPVITNHFPKADIEMIEGAGHWIHADRQDEVVERVRAFLAAHAGASL
ncbi:MAG: alpha/beta fold hydrolase [Spirochaetaceae bacterium]|nr:MAG: alpha/beta fold hydrolase [Spirochaetaceae bacterium]